MEGVVLASRCLPGQGESAGVGGNGKIESDFGCFIFYFYLRPLNFLSINQTNINLTKKNKNNLKQEIRVSLIF